MRRTIAEVSSAQPAPDSTPGALADSERALLCDLFLRVGPHAPTLCAGWDTHHLAAHLVFRDGDTVRLVHVALSGSSEAAVEELVHSTDFTELVARVRTGPSPKSVFALPGVGRVTGTLEFFIHHEDVRRAGPRWTPRALSPAAQEDIWSPLRISARVLMRRSPVGVELARSDAHGSARGAKGADAVVVRGLPSELALFAFGRGRVARVEIDGSERGIAAMRAAAFGI